MSSNMPSKLTAEMVSVWSDDSLAGAALAENSDSSGWNLVLERARAFSDADRKAGQDTYCITNEAGAAVYGGIANWSLTGTALSLSLSDAAAAELGVSPELTIALHVSPAEIKQLGKSLTAILE